MKRRLMLLFFLTCTLGGRAETLFFKFSLWDELTGPEKPTFLVGFTNGLLAGATHPIREEETMAKQLAVCLTKSPEPIGLKQAVAMIDKYYRENPEQWNRPLAEGIVRALSVKGGPCPAKDGTPE